MNHFLLTKKGCNQYRLPYNSNWRPNNNLVAQFSAKRLISEKRNSFNESWGGFFIVFLVLLTAMNPLIFIFRSYLNLSSFNGHCHHSRFKTQLKSANNMELVQMTREAITDLVFRTSELAYKRAMIDTQQIRCDITLAKIRELYGETTAKKARFCPFIDWSPIGKGALTSGVRCSRIQFEKFLFQYEYSFYL